MNQDTFEEDLNQIRKTQLEIINEIDEMKDKATGADSDDLARIQNEANRVVFEIDEIRKRRDNTYNTRTARSQFPHENGSRIFFSPWAS